MMYKNFRLNIFIRVFIVVILAIAMAYVLLKNPMFFVLSAIVIALVGTVISLIHYIEKSNRDLLHFLMLVREGVFTESYTAGNRGKQFEHLSEAFNDIAKEFGKLTRDRELHYQYLQTLNENINVAILSFDADGKLLMMNPAAKNLLNSPWFTRLDDFRKIDPDLHAAVAALTPDQRRVVKVFIGEGQYQLSVQSKEIILNGNFVRIILLQNLNSELEEKEIDAWHQLMRVLTHEIMNSVTPIVSLTGAIETILKKPDGSRKDLSHLTHENADDIFSSLATIHARSKGLLKFVNAYRSYAKPIELHLEQADVLQLVRRSVDLFRRDLENRGVMLDFHEPAGVVQASVDIALMEQVLINLLKNALEAVPHDGSGRIELGVRASPATVSISVRDNGPGIVPEVLPRIFVPFYTTKPNGSGIGLSLCRQIMKLHNGSIRVTASNPGSTFTIEWIK